MRNVLLSLVVLVTFGAFAPVASAQEATPATTTISPSVIDPAAMVMIEKMAGFCPTCQLEDFFPLIRTDGTIDNQTVIFWPRLQKGTFDVPDGVKIAIESADGRSLNTEGKGHYPDLRWAALTSREQFDNELLTSVDDMPTNLPSTAQMCYECGNIEYAPWQAALGVRIAYAFQVGNDVTIADDIALFAWDQGELKLYYGPGTIANLPPAHMWATVSLQG